MNHARFVFCYVSLLFSIIQFTRDIQSYLTGNLEEHMWMSHIYYHKNTQKITMVPAVYHHAIN